MVKWTNTRALHPVFIFCWHHFQPVAFMLSSLPSTSNPSPFILLPLHWSAHSGSPPHPDSSLTPARLEQALLTNWKTQCRCRIRGCSVWPIIAHKQTHAHQHEWDGRFIDIFGCGRPGGNSLELEHREKWEMWLSPRHKLDALCVSAELRTVRAYASARMNIRVYSWVCVSLPVRRNELHSKSGSSGSGSLTLKWKASSEAQR